MSEFFPKIHKEGESASGTKKTVVATAAENLREQSQVIAELRVISAQQEEERIKVLDKPCMDNKREPFNAKVAEYCQSVRAKHQRELLVAQLIKL